MEPNPQRAVAKRLWRILRVAFFMVKKCIISKRKLMMHFNLMVKRGKLLSNSFRKKSLISYHYFSTSMRRGFTGLDPHDYECSCNVDIPNLLNHLDSNSPLWTLCHDESPVSVRVSSYKSDDEDGYLDGNEVDDRAEEFIRRFYEQLRVQNRLQMVEWQEM